ncbi:MAG: hypothetical protein PHF50_04225 [Patescibacteria group bacterium]|nr:hypothetical protein [Patescibacteria group bacterium]
MANKKILLGLTTITPGEWKNKVKEIDELGLKEIALFSTCLEYGERQELYRLLEDTGLVSIPHVHLREQDTESHELDYLVKRFKTQVFNIHSKKEEFDFIKRNKKYKDRIYVENIFMDDNFSEVLKNCAGICLDLSHWESYGFLKKYQGYAELPELLKKYKIGVNHISAIKKEITHCHDNVTNQDFYSYDSHWLDDLSEMDYVKKYKNYLADIISIELENPLKEQLEVKKYLEEIIL